MINYGFYDSCGWLRAGMRAQGPKTKRCLVSLKDASSTASSSRRIQPICDAIIGELVVSVAAAIAVDAKMTARALVLLLSCQLSTALLAPARRVRTPRVVRAVSDDATVLFLHGDGVSNVYGASSPRPNPAHATVASQLARRVGHFDAKVRGTTDAAAGDVVIGLGVTDASKTKATLSAAPAVVLRGRRRVLAGRQGAGVLRGVGAIQCGSARPIAKSPPVHDEGRVARACWRRANCFSRGASEDALFAALFLVHALVRPCAVVARVESDHAIIEQRNLIAITSSRNQGLGESGETSKNSRPWPTAAARRSRRR